MIEGILIFFGNLFLLISIRTGFTKSGFGVLAVGKADRQHPKIFFFPRPGAGVRGWRPHGVQTL